MVAGHVWQSMTVNEWRELEQRSHDVKHEYIDGYIYAMAGGTLDHSLVAVNAVALLNDAFGDGPCIAYNSDATARLSPTCYTYPDATVTCDERDRGRTREVQTPRLIVEVLSDTTEAYDRGDKFGYYRQCPTVQEYVLISTKCQLIEVFRRMLRGWEYQSYGPGDEVELTSIHLRFPLAALYRRTTVPETLEIHKGEV